MACDPDCEQCMDIDREDDDNLLMEMLFADELKAFRKPDERKKEEPARRV